MHQIIIKIKPDGSTNIKAEGYTGPSCSTVTKPFIDALGQKLSDLPTAEFFAEVAQQQELHQ